MQPRIVPICGLFILALEGAALRPPRFVSTYPTQVSVPSRK